MAKKFLFGLTLISFFQIGCKSDLKGKLTQAGNASLQLYEESQGALVEITEGEISLKSSLDLSIKNALMGLVSPVKLIITQAENSFALYLDPKNINDDGSFFLDEVALGQPVKVKGRWISSDASSDPSDKYLEIEIYKGFSKEKSPIWKFRSDPVEPSTLKQLRPIGPVAAQASL